MPQERSLMGIRCRAGPGVRSFPCPSPSVIRNWSLLAMFPGVCGQGVWLCWYREVLTGDEWAADKERAGLSLLFSVWLMQRLCWQLGILRVPGSSASSVYLLHLDGPSGPDNTTFLLWAPSPGEPWLPALESLGCYPVPVWLPSLISRQWSHSVVSDSLQPHEL